MSRADIPHEYPFRFVDTVTASPGTDVSDGRVRVRVTGNGRGTMGEVWRSPLLLAEAIAQAALLLEGGDAEASRRGYLAGLDGFEFARSPRAGETLEIRVKLTARFGPVVRFDGEVRTEDEGAEILAKGAVLVRKDPGGRAAAEPAP